MRIIITLLFFIAVVSCDPGEKQTPAGGDLETRLQKVEALTDSTFTNYLWLQGSNASLAKQIRETSVQALSADRLAQTANANAKEAQKLAGVAWHTSEAIKTQAGNLGAEIARIDNQYNQLRIGFSGLAGQVITLQNQNKENQKVIEELTRQNAILSAAVESLTAQQVEIAETAQNAVNRLKLLTAQLENCAVTKFCFK